MNELIANLAKHLVDEPDQVAVNSRTPDGSVLELRVAPGDVGKVIGRQGRTARSLRTILTAASSKQNRRCTLEIVE